MRPFQCQCGARVFFENTACLTCGRTLGFLPDIGQMGVFEVATGTPPPASQTPVGRSRFYRKCENYVQANVCNWMVPADDKDPLCQACRLTDVIPDLSDPRNLERWSNAESAKRRLIYSLNRLRLPVVPKKVDPERGLAFELKNDTGEARVLTGHEEGLITLNLNEADPVAREKARTQMHEQYRTLLGHFRHEIGHYYWNLLVRDGVHLPRVRELFGDEQVDYRQSLERHYAREPSDAWKGSFVSAYATSHPWEDWAETWAHYLHMVDTLETANAFNVNGHALSNQTGGAPTFDKLMSEWVELTVVLNALSRSLGHGDLYPFEIGDGAHAKLALIHEIITAKSNESALIRSFDDGRNP
jgi:hypothetical protein